MTAITQQDFDFFISALDNVKIVQQHGIENVTWQGRNFALNTTKMGWIRRLVNLFRALFDCTFDVRAIQVETDDKIKTLKIQVALLKFFIKVAEEHADPSDHNSVRIAKVLSASQSILGAWNCKLNQPSLFMRIRNAWDKKIGYDMTSHKADLILSSPIVPPALLQLNHR